MTIGRDCIDRDFTIEVTHHHSCLTRGRPGNTLQPRQVIDRLVVRLELEEQCFTIGTELCLVILTGGRCDDLRFDAAVGADAIEMEANMGERRIPTLRVAVNTTS